MPFEPSKHPADAEQFASPQLEMLADQLRHDAQWLSAKYPAHKPRLPLARPRRLRWVAVASVAVLMLLSVDAWRMWTTPVRQSPDAFVQTESPTALTNARPKGYNDLNGADKVDGPRMSPITQPLTNARPAVLGYNDLSPAEKEALLDLLEQRPPARLKVSL